MKVLLALTARVPAPVFCSAPLPAMMLSLGLIAAAYLAEVFRGALDSVDAAEILAAQAMGMAETTRSG